MVEFLLAQGADPNVQTRIDDDTSPLEEAESWGHTEIVHLLRNAAQKQGPILEIAACGIFVLRDIHDREKSLRPLFEVFRVFNVTISLVDDTGSNVLGFLKKGATLNLYENVN